MNWSSGVWPSRNFSASLSKSSNSRSRMGMMWPGTSSRTSGLASVPFRPCVVEGSIGHKVSPWKLTGIYFSESRPELIPFESCPAQKT